MITSVGGVAISANQHEARVGIVLQNDLKTANEGSHYSMQYPLKTQGNIIVTQKNHFLYLVYDSTSRFPEADSIFGGRGGEKVVDLLVCLLCPLEVVAGPRLGLDQVITVNRRGNSNLKQRGREGEEGSEHGIPRLNYSHTCSEYDCLLLDWVRLLYHKSGYSCR